MRRCAVAFITGIALIFAIVLAASPRLHDSIHKSSGPDHECAATIFATGKCDTTASPMVIETHRTLSFASIFPPDFSHAVAAVPCSILEHAPPRAR